MNSNYHILRAKQLARNLAPFMGARGLNRPVKGWISAMREVSGVTLRELASKLGISHQSVAALEKAEAEERITLKRLRNAADALECELVYALVPKKGTVADFAQAKSLKDATDRVLAVEHSMALEGQQVGGVEQKIKEEATRCSKHA